MVMSSHTTLTRPPRRVRVTKTVDDILAAADKAAPELRRALLNALGEMRNRVPDLTALLEAGRLDEVIAAVNVQIPSDMIDTIRDSLADTAAAAARPSAAVFGIAFNDVNIRAVRWAERNAAAQITAISGTTRRAVGDAVTDAIRQGTNPRVLAQHIENLVGLTPGHAKAVDRLFNSFDLDTQLDQALRVSGAKSRRLLRWRAETIARTETIRAANTGQQLSWDTALDEGLLPSSGVEKVWIATGDDRTCPICAVLDDQVVEVSGEFGVNRQATSFTRDGDDFTVTGTRAMRTPTTTRTPPAHPRCRCTVGLGNIVRSLEPHPPGTCFTGVRKAQKKPPKLIKPGPGGFGALGTKPFSEVFTTKPKPKPRARRRRPKPATGCLLSEQWDELDPAKQPKDPGRRRDIRDRIDQVFGETKDGRLVRKFVDKWSSTGEGSVRRFHNNITDLLNGVEATTPALRRAKATLQALRRSQIKAPKLFRGKSVSGKLDDVIKRFQVGSTQDWHLSSFTTDSKVANKFATNVLGGNRTAVRIVVEAGDMQQALPIQNLSTLWREKEWLGGGRFEIVKVTKRSAIDLTVTVRQVASL